MQTARVFTNGNSQAVRLPKEFRFDDKEVAITRVGDMVVLLPQHHDAKQLLALLDGFEPEFTIQREQPSDVEERRPGLD
jgi:antitoxin VapB